MVVKNHMNPARMAIMVLKPSPLKCTPSPAKACQWKSLVSLAEAIRKIAAASSAAVTTITKMSLARLEFLPIR